MEKLVPSYETAKKLSEFGWTAETYFVWVEEDGVAFIMPYDDDTTPNDIIPAPTAQEMLEHMLTEYYIDPNHEDEAFMVICDVGTYGINVCYEYVDTIDDEHTTSEDFDRDGKNLADALAEMYLENPKSRRQNV